MVGGENVWVCNVYLPPRSCLVKRDIDEVVARSYVTDILSEVPFSARAVVCGDWNTRVSTASPRVGEVQLTRCSMDVIRCARANWFIDVC